MTRFPEIALENGPTRAQDSPDIIAFGLDWSPYEGTYDSGPALNDILDRLNDHLIAARMGPSYEDYKRHARGREWFVQTNFRNGCAAGG